MFNNVLQEDQLDAVTATGQEGCQLDQGLLGAAAAQVGHDESDLHRRTARRSTALSASFTDTSVTSRLTGWRSW